MTTDIQTPKKQKSQRAEIWRRFKQNPLAMIGLGIIIVLILMAILAPVIAPATERDPGYDIMDLSNTFASPSLDNIMGTDQFGRDVFARLVWGARTSILVGVVVMTISLTVGVTIGAIAGYYGGVVDNLIMRIIDIVLAIPTILLAIVIAASIGGGLMAVLVAVGIGGIPGFARLVRASVLSVRGQEYIEAAHAIGASDFRIIRKHVLPNCMAPIIVEATMGMAGAIGAAAALAFLGLGMDPPSPEWGSMLSAGRNFMLAGHTHLVLFPGLAIALVIFALNMMGDGLRDAFDPRLKK